MSRFAWFGIGVVVMLAFVGLWCVLYVANRAVRVAVRGSISRPQ